MGSGNDVFLGRQGEKGCGRRIRGMRRRGCWNPEITFSSSGRGKRAADAEFGGKQAGLLFSIWAAQKPKF